LQNPVHLDLGYSSDRLAVMAIDAAPGGYSGPTLNRLYLRILERVHQTPGVRAVTLSHNGLFNDSDSGDEISV
jgi:hypothetical protein